MSNGVIVKLQLTLVPQAIDAFLAGLPAMVKDTSAMKGFRDLRACRDPHNPDVLVLIEEWDSAEDHAAYMAWRAARPEAADVAKLFAAPPALEVFARVL